MVGVELSPQVSGAVSAARPTAVDLFAGVGGFSLGFEQAGFDVLAAVEYDAIHAATYSYNFPLTEVLCRDAALIGVDDIRRAIARGAKRHGRRAPTDLDVVFGGTPCQGFSAGGKRSSSDPRNMLVLEFLRLVSCLRPKYFVMENVPAMRSFVDPSDPNRSLLDRLTKTAEQAGYEALDPVVVNAAFFGVPQDRRRVILIGGRPDEQVPAQLPQTAMARPKRTSGREPGFSDDLPLGPSVWDAIGDLPSIDDFDRLWDSDTVELTPEGVAEMEQACSQYARSLRGLEVAPRDRAYPRRWNRALLTSSMRTRHSIETIARFAATTPGGSEPVSRYYRLDPHGLSSTLRAGTGYERGSFMAPRPIHPTANRVISAREAGRLHAFPDWFRFHGTKWHAFRQIGNAVPPLLGRAIALQIVDALRASPSKPQCVIELGDPRLLTLPNRLAAARLGADLNESPSHRLRTRGRSPGL